MICKLCSSELESIGSVPFDKNCVNLPTVSAKFVEYYRCKNCGSIMCPEMLEWSSERLGEEVYNEEYVKYDPEYVSIRPTNWANSLENLKYKSITHLDYGSGSGIMSNLLKEKGWKSTAYDPFSNNIKPTKKYNFITAIEVIEHSTDVEATIKDMQQYLARDGVILFSTLLAEKDFDIDWWYIMPRNGHICFPSKVAMVNIAKRNGLFFASLDQGVHILQTSRSAARQLGLNDGRQ